MVKWFVVFVVVLTTVGCGNGSVPTIAYPAHGQKIVLSTLTQGCFDVTLSDNDYQSTTIEVSGVVEQLGTELTCRPGNYAPASCCRSFSSTAGFPSGGFGNCTEQRPCPLTLIARRGDLVDVKVIKIVR